MWFTEHIQPEHAVVFPIFLQDFQAYFYVISRKIPFCLFSSCLCHTGRLCKNLHFPWEGGTLCVKEAGLRCANSMQPGTERLAVLTVFQLSCSNAILVFLLSSHLLLSSSSLLGSFYGIWYHSRHTMPEFSYSLPPEALLGCGWSINQSISQCRCSTKKPS